jgi:hypothetical protein
VKKVVAGNDDTTRGVQRSNKKNTRNKKIITAQAIAITFRIIDMAWSLIMTFPWEILFRDVANITITRVYVVDNNIKTNRSGISRVSLNNPSPIL